MKLKPNETRRHHYVAQCLQRQLSFDNGSHIYTFDILSRSNFILSQPKACKIEDNLQGKDMFLIDKTKDGKQYNLESEFKRAEDIFGNNIRKLNQITFEEMKRNLSSLRDIFKNLAVYVFLDVLRSPLRLTSLAQFILNTNQTFQDYLYNSLSTCWLNNAPNIHTKLLAAVFESNDYIEIFNVLLTKTEAWVSATLFCYTENFLGDSGIALSDYSVLEFNEDNGIVNYVICISHNKLFSIRINIGLVLSIISNHAGVKKRRHYQPDIRVKINNEKMLRSYNLLAIQYSKDHIFSNKKVIFGLNNSHIS